MSDLRARMAGMTRFRTVRVLSAGLMFIALVSLIYRAEHRTIAALAARIGPGAWGYLGAAGVVATAGYVLWRTVRYLPVLLTMRRAERLLRRQRSAGQGRVWSARDWEWAFTHLGTPIALEFAAKFRRLQSVGGDHPDQRT